MSSTSNIVLGQIVALNGSSNSPAQSIAPGSLVTAINGAGSSITISVPLAGVLAAGTKLYFGASQAAGSTLEVQRQAYNTFVRANWRSGATACTGVMDVDAILADQGGSGKWRTDLGQASADGVHPSAALHQAVVSAKLLSAASFQVP
jgi:hypothetical protein